MLVLGLLLLGAGIGVLAFFAGELRRALRRRRARRRSGARRAGARRARARRSRARRSRARRPAPHADNSGAR
ncbi:MAG TPA: hypothetical protein VKZ74_06200 [Natronosporangium sp.]|nr:hypothetical protein [Natronosporangium sp.]